MEWQTKAARAQICASEKLSTGTCLRTYLRPRWTRPRTREIVGRGCPSANQYWYCSCNPQLLTQDHFGFILERDQITKSVCSTLKGLYLLDRNRYPTEIKKLRDVDILRQTTNNKNLPSASQARARDRELKHFILWWYGTLGTQVRLPLGWFLFILHSDTERYVNPDT